MRHPKQTKPSISVFVAVLAIATLALGLIGLTLSLMPSEPPQGAVRDMRGNLVTPMPGATPDAVKLASMKVVSQQNGERFAVPKVGLDVPLGALNDVDGVITPPGMTSAYVVRNRGVGLDQAAKGTVFVVMHSLMGGGMGPGNYLIDEEHQTSRVPMGAVITVGKLKYKVTGFDPINRGELAQHAEVWKNTPNRLVVITCLLTPGDNAPIDNLVITATRIH